MVNILMVIEVVGHFLQPTIINRVNGHGKMLSNTKNKIYTIIIIFVIL